MRTLINMAVSESSSYLLVTMPLDHCGGLNGNQRSIEASNTFEPINITVGPGEVHLLSVEEPQLGWKFATYAPQSNGRTLSGL